ncbi:MAG TPA: amidohydrolase family protein [Pseudonocardiaceae bacterium]
MTILSCIADLPLIDHHCHGLIRTDLDRTSFEELLTEADTVSPLGTTLFDSTIGLAVRRWCAPILDLPAHAPAEDYLARRAELGATEVNRRLVATTGATDLLVDSGFRPEQLTTTDELATLTGIRTHEIVRLESLAESVLHDDGDFAMNCAEALAKRNAIGCKSVAAYRVGLRLSGVRPTDAEVRTAVDRWRQSGNPRLADETLHRYLVWLAIENRLPVQFHVGYGDADLDLHECDPLLLTGLLRATEHTGVPIMLLHNYPYQRQAGYLAQVFQHVFVDVGLATHHAGFRGPGLIAELLEIAPFGKVLYSSDSFGLAEHYLLGALLFRRGLSDFLATGITEDALTPEDAGHIARLIGHQNARRLYQFTPGDVLS